MFAKDYSDEFQLYNRKLLVALSVWSVIAYATGLLKGLFAALDWYRNYRHHEKMCGLKKYHVFYWEIVHCNEFLPATGAQACHQY